MKTNFLFCLFILLLAFPFLSCNNTDSHKEEVINSDDSIALIQSQTNTIPSEEFEMVISDIPFPFEILDNLYSKKILFDQKAMNPVSNVVKCNQYNSKALNLGIYGADLSYAVTYEEFKQMGAYVKITKQLAEELNIPYAFDQSMMDKY